MANVGNIIQHQGPFTASSTFGILNGQHCKIGISIGQDDFMFWPTSTALGGYGHPFYFEINGQKIEMGRTFMYQTDASVDMTHIPSSTISLKFPDGAPASTIVDIVYYAE